MHQIVSQMYLAVCIGLSHLESPTEFSQDQPPLASIFWKLFPTFHYRSSSICCLTILSSLEPFKPPPNDTQYFSRSWKAFSNIVFLLQTKLSSYRYLNFFPILEPHPKCSCSFSGPWCTSLSSHNAV